MESAWQPAFRYTSSDEHFQWTSAIGLHAFCLLRCSTLDTTAGPPASARSSSIANSKCPFTTEGSTDGNLRRTLTAALCYAAARHRHRQSRVVRPCRVQMQMFVRSNSPALILVDSIPLVLLPQPSNSRVFITWIPHDILGPRDMLHHRVTQSPSALQVRKRPNLT